MAVILLRPQQASQRVRSIIELQCTASFAVRLDLHLWCIKNCLIE